MCGEHSTFEWGQHKPTCNALSPICAGDGEHSLPHYGAEELWGVHQQHPISRQERVQHPTHPQCQQVHQQSPLGDILVVSSFGITMVSRYEFYSFKIVFSPLPFVWINMTKLDLVLEFSIQPPLMVRVTWPIDHLWTCLAPPPCDFDWCNKAFSKLALFRRPWWRAWQKDWQMSSYLPSLAPCPCIHSAYPSIYVDKYFWVRSSNHSASLVFAQPSSDKFNQQTNKHMYVDWV